MVSLSDGADIVGNSDLMYEKTEQESKMHLVLKHDPIPINSFQVMHKQIDTISIPSPSEWP